MSKYWENYWNSINGGNKQKSVGRTKFGNPVNQNDFQRELVYIDENLKLNGNDVLIDLCAGNGLITKEFFDKVEKVYAIDFSLPLLKDFEVDSPKVEVICQDINQFDFSQINFNKLIWYFSIQHFNYSEVLIILKKILDNIQDVVVVYIVDVPDINKKWEFYSKKEYKSFYFNKLLNNEDHIGTWFQREFFQSSLSFLGYSGKFKILDKPKEHFNSSYRFDIVINT